MRSLLCSAIVIALISLVSPGLAASPGPGPDDSADAPGLDAVGFLSGTWRGAMGADMVEEIWSRPAGDSIVGTFRWLAGGQRTQLVEIITITKRDDGIVMYLRHFDAALVPWPSEKEPVTLRLADHGTGRAIFETIGEQDVASIGYEKDGSSLTATVTFKASTGRSPLALRFAKVE